METPNTPNTSTRCIGYAFPCGQPKDSEMEYCDDCRDGKETDEEIAAERDYDDEPEYDEAREREQIYFASVKVR